MRWTDFLRLRIGHHVRWIPTNERGIVRKRRGRELWVEWTSGRVEKLHVEEDAYALAFDDYLARRREVSEVELARRRSLSSLRPDPVEDGSPEELERVWREAAEIRAQREYPAKKIEPSWVPVGGERRAER